MSAPVPHEAPPPFALRSGRWLLIRHLLAIAVTVLVVMAAWTVASAPIVAVFVIDGAFDASGYVEAVLAVAGFVSAATLAITPVALGLERLVLRGGAARTAMAVLLPVALFVAIAACVAAMVKLTESPGAYVAAAVAAFLMFVLVIYWPTLWLLNLASYVLRRARHAQRLRRSRSLPGGRGLIDVR